MNYKKIELSKKREAFNKGLVELIDILTDVASGNDDGSPYEYTDNEGNRVVLEFDLNEDKTVTIISLEMTQKNSAVTINIAKPTKNLLHELEHTKSFQL